jgi:hypothetical protein
VSDLPPTPDLAALVEELRAQVGGVVVGKDELLAGKEGVLANQDGLIEAQREQLGNYLMGGLGLGVEGDFCDTKTLTILMTPRTKLWVAIFPLRCISPQNLNLGDYAVGSTIPVDLLLG